MPTPFPILHKRTVDGGIDAITNTDLAPAQMYGEGGGFREKNKLICHWRKAGGPGECKRCAVLRPQIFIDCDIRPSVSVDEDGNIHEYGEWRNPLTPKYDHQR